MAQQQSPSSLQVSRIFEQPEGAISCYSDMAQVIGTGNEVILQFYETIPGAPGAGGQIQTVRTRLRVTVTISPAHAMNIGNLLLQQSGRSAQTQQQSPSSGGTT